MSASYEKQPLEAVLADLSDRYGIPFFFNDQRVAAQPAVSLTLDSVPLAEALNSILASSDLAWKAVGSQVVLKGLDQLENPDQWTVPAKEATFYTVSGHLVDETTGEALIGAIVRVADRPLGVVTNEYGYFSLRLPMGNYDLEGRILGYQPKPQRIELNRDQRLRFSLQAAQAQLQTVTITDSAAPALTALEAEIQRMPMQQAAATPALLGTRNVLDGVQLQPGVTRKTEGSNGFFVRGGNVDQNLILIDEAPVYNESHFLGFLSVFNWNTIQHAQLYKDGVPARFGGRLSSVLDIRMKEGNDQRWTGSGEVTPLYAQGTVEGPLRKNVASVLVSARRSWPDLFLQQEFENEANVEDFSFYDLNGKVNWRLSERDRLYLSGYWGDDFFFGQEEDFTFQQWGNRTATFRWNHVYGPRLFSNLALITSRYDFASGEDVGSDSYYFALGIGDLTAKLDYQWYPHPKHTVRFGGIGTRHFFDPGSVEITELEFSEFVNIVDPQRAMEYGAYLSDQWQVNERLNVYAGLRFSAFLNFGEAIINTYDQDGGIVATRFNEDGIYERNGGLEPRLSVQYQVSKNGLLSGSVDVNRQYLHLATNTITKAPTDLWIPSSPNVEPQVGQQYSLGYWHTFPKEGWRVGVDLWYKNIEGAIDFRERANLVLNELLESEIGQGGAQADGVELLVQKTRGRLTGMLSYTYSSVWLEVEGINNGLDYRAAWDRPHDLAALAQFHLNERWRFAANFVFASGLPTNFPIANYSLQGEDFIAYDTKNEDRLPPYHRLDVSATYTGRTDLKWRSEWVFGIYNVYNRYNAYTIVFDEPGGSVQPGDGRKYYVFPILPSISYRFSF